MSTPYSKLRSLIQTRIDFWKPTQVQELLDSKAGRELPYPHNFDFSIIEDEELISALERYIVISMKRSHSR